MKWILSALLMCLGVNASAVTLSDFKDNSGNRLFSFEDDTGLVVLSSSSYTGQVSMPSLSVTGNASMGSADVTGYLTSDHASFSGGLFDVWTSSADADMTFYVDEVRIDQGNNLYFGSLAVSGNSQSDALRVFPSVSGFGGIHVDYANCGAGEFAGLNVSSDDSLRTGIARDCSTGSALVGEFTSGAAATFALSGFAQIENGAGTAYAQFGSGGQTVIGGAGTSPTHSIELNGGNGDVSINGEDIELNVDVTDGVLKMNVGGTAQIEIGSANTAQGSALCINASNELSICTTSVDVSGQCTCSP
jgi:hypothetical protein